MAYTYRNKSQVNAQTGTTISHDHTPGAATTLMILSIIVAGTSARSGTPTIGGTNATKIDSTRSSTEHQVEVWYLAGSWAGTSAITCSIPNAAGLTCHIEVVSADSGAGTELNNANGAVAGSATDDGVSVNVTAAAIGDFLYCRLVCGEAATSSVAEGSGTPTKNLSYANDHGAYTSFGHYANADSTGTETFTYTWSNDVGAVVAGAWKTTVSPVSVPVTTETANFGEAVPSLVLSGVKTAPVETANFAEVPKIMMSEVKVRIKAS